MKALRFLCILTALSALFLLCACGTEKQPGDTPDDFAFSIVWGCYGQSSYDSRTGKLVKTTYTSDADKFTAYVKLTEEQLNEIYRILFYDTDITGYPDEYDPFLDPVTGTSLMSRPTGTVIISATANGVTKTVTCKNIALGEPDRCPSEEGKAFLTAKSRIAAVIKSLPEWEAFPDYEVHFE